MRVGVYATPCAGAHLAQPCNDARPLRLGRRDQALELFQILHNRTEQQQQQVAAQC